MMNLTTDLRDVECEYCGKKEITRSKLPCVAEGPETGFDAVILENGWVEDFGGTIACEFCFETNGNIVTQTYSLLKDAQKVGV